MAVKSSVALSSRFAVLSVDENDGSESKQQRKKSAKKESGTKSTQLQNSNGTSKKKNAKSNVGSGPGTTISGQGGTDVELRQLREMAFLTSKKSKKQLNQGSGDTRPKDTKKSAQWDEWKSKDEQFVDEQFEKDLMKALEESKTSFLEQPKQLQVVFPDDAANKKQDKENRKHEKEKPSQSGKKKEKVNTNCTQSTFQQKGQNLSAIEPIFISDNPNKDTVQPPSNSKKGEMNKAKKKIKFEVLEKENVKYIAESVRIIQLEDELSKKNADIEQLTSTVEELKKELSQVRKRNQQLCFILGQGEMKDKSEVLTQVEELTNIKDELTEEVSMLHRVLEQERSKVSSLRTELTKYQHQDGRKKHE